MATFSTAELYGMTIRESANDGSDFTNPSADYRRLFLGETGGIFTRDSAGTIHNVAPGVGTAFPATPGTNSRFFRTDYGMEFYYNGSIWLSTQLSEIRLVSDIAYPLTVTNATRAGVPILVGSDIYLVKAQTNFYVVGGTALSASHKWIGVLVKSPAGTTIDTITIDSGALNTWRQSTATSINAAMGATNFEFDVNWTKTGTPGNLFAFTVISYRHIAV